MPVYGKASTYETVEEGLYLCVCKGVAYIQADKWVNGVKQEGVTEEKLEFLFETLDHFKQSDGGAFGFRLRVYPSYGSPKANLTKFADKMFGRSFTAEEWARLDLEKLVGRHFQVFVDCKESGGRVYNNIISVIPVRKEGQSNPPAAQKPVAASRPPATIDEVYDPFADNIQDGSDDDNPFKD